MKINKKLMTLVIGAMTLVSSAVPSFAADSCDTKYINGKQCKVCITCTDSECTASYEVLNGGSSLEEVDLSLRPFDDNSKNKVTETFYGTEGSTSATCDGTCSGGQAYGSFTFEDGTGGVGPVKSTN